MNEVSLVVKEIPKEVITDANTAFQTGFALLKPYLQAVTTEDRRKLFKMSDGGEPFVIKGAEYVQSNPEFVPSYMDVDSLNTAYTVYVQLMPFRNMFADFDSMVVDTRMVAGSQALKEVLKYYNVVKEAMINRVPGAKSIYEELKKRFARKKSKKVKDATDKMNAAGKAADNKAGDDAA